MARALTKRRLNGTLYVRPVTIETAIHKALGQDLATLRRRAYIRDPPAADYLPSECLVHLIREARMLADDATMNALLPILLERCESILLSRIPDGRIADAAGVRETVLERFAELFALDGTHEDTNQLDFYEVRFNRAFRTFRIDVVRQETSRLSELAQFPEIEDEEGAAIPLDEVFHRLSEAARASGLPDLTHAPGTGEEAATMQELLDAIAALPAAERAAVTLCHVMGYKEESEDPTRVTAATLCQVTGRTIRNRLARAAVKLARFREEI